APFLESLYKAGNSGTVAATWRVALHIRLRRRSRGRPAQTDQGSKPVTTSSLDSFTSRKQMTVDGRSYSYFSLSEAERNGLGGVSRLPFTLKVLLENLLRHEDGRTVSRKDIEAMAGWLAE